MKVLAFAGSISSTSINKKLLAHVVESFASGNEVEVLDLNDYEMPIYSEDRERTEGVHPLAVDFAGKIDGSDLIVMALAEHNSAYSTAFKNVFDWISRVPGRAHFGGKPIFLLSTAPGQGGGLHVSELFMKRAPHSGGEVIANFVLPQFQANFREGEGVVDEAKRKELEAKIAEVKKALGL